MKALKVFILMAVFLLLSFSSYAQEKTISGTVYDDQGYPLPGVTVVQKGTTKGTITDIDGKYTFSAPKGSVLVFSFVGMETEELTVGESNVLNLNMRLTSMELKEIQIIGYGAIKSKDNTGSQTTVKSENIAKIPTSTLAEGLQGSAPGLLVTQGNGQLESSGSLQIRGTNSINLSSEPLIIIDGVQMVGGLNLINQNDVESVEVLKDAKATAIYGSLGSAGVIIITTKRGQKSKPATNINFSTSMGTLSKNYKDMNYANTQEWFAITDQARANTFFNQPPEQTQMQPNDVTKFFKENAETGDTIVKISREDALNTNTDWFDQVLQTSVVNNISFSTSGGYEKMSFFASGNYEAAKGVIVGEAQNKLNARLNVTYEPVNRIQMGTNLSMNHVSNDRIRGGTGWGGSFGSANRNSLPWFPIYNEEHPTGYWNPLSGYNIAANNDRDLIDDRGKSYRGILNNYIEYKIPYVEGLKLRSEVNIDLITYTNYTYTSKYLNQKGSTATTSNGTAGNLTYNLYSNYDKSFGENHTITGTIGFERKEKKGYYSTLEARGLTTSYHYIGSASTPPEEKISMTSNIDGEEYLMSYFTRGDYKFKNWLLLGGSYRIDGSSMFFGKNKWGAFKAASAGIKINEMAFFQNLNMPYVSLLKIRGSIGQTGNNRIEASVFNNIYSNSAKNRYGTMDLIAGGTAITNLGNKDIRWETTNSYDFGLDYGFLKDRFQGSIAYYMQDIIDVLLASPMPISSPVSSYWENIGEFKNWGWEFNISSVNIDKPLAKFKWKSDFNISTNQNQIVKMARGGQYQISGNYINMEGQEIKTWYMPEWAGLDRERGIDLINQIDLAKWKSDAVTENTGYKIPATLTNMGDNKKVLEDKNGQVSYFGGLSNKIEFKGFDLGFRFIYQGGNYIYDYVEQRTTTVGDGTYVLRKDLLTDSWTPDNKNARYPQLAWGYQYYYGWDEETKQIVAVDKAEGYNLTSQYMSRYLYRGDFIRLKTVDLGYNFSKGVITKMGLSSLRLYGSVSNVFVITFSDFRGWDPATGDASIPPVRMFTFGVNINL